MITLVYICNRLDTIIVVTVDVAYLYSVFHIGFFVHCRVDFSARAVLIWQHKKYEFNYFNKKNYIPLVNTLNNIETDCDNQILVH